MFAVHDQTPGLPWRGYRDEFEIAKAGGAETLRAYLRELDLEFGTLPPTEHVWAMEGYLHLSDEEGVSRHYRWLLDYGETLPRSDQST